MESSPNKAMDSPLLKAEMREKQDKHPKQQMGGVVI